MNSSSETHARPTSSHPNVCRVYDVGEIEGSGLTALGSRPTAQGPGTDPAGAAAHPARRLFLTMEYVDGEDLASLQRQIGKPPAAKALEAARQRFPRRSA
jgi:serine/threonine protein kinase